MNPATADPVLGEGVLPSKTSNDQPQKGHAQATCLDYIMNTGSVSLQNVLKMKYRLQSPARCWKVAMSRIMRRYVRRSPSMKSPAN